MRQHYKAFRRARGFTLIELLVVVALIAILIAVLLPALNKARIKSQTVRCLSNEKALIQAMISYAGDNDGFLPPPNWDGGITPITANAPPGWLYQPSVVTGNGGFGMGLPSGVTSNVQTGLLWQYLNSLDVYRCPLDSSTWPSTSVQYITSYVMNGAVCDYNSVNPEKLRSFKTTAALLWELPSYLSQPSGSINDGANAPCEGISIRHGHGSDVAFADGHAEFWTWSQFVNAWEPSTTTTTTPGQLWCAPHSSSGLGGVELYTPLTGFQTAEPTSGN